ncbi:MAG: NAD(P)H-dependent glycerol-3-phosphate dehydrogenase [Gammaproteobacteria bacterium]|nr:NAD(P)H-dependent glycerol-3-phosphate dehydrogenase [Gammaproteobacteria bacterium]
MPHKAAHPVAVLGAGSYGTALALLLARNGQDLRLWGRNPEAMAALARDRVNARYLPDVRLPDNLKPTADLGQALEGVRDVLIVVPSPAFDETLNLLKAHARPDWRLVWATKGLAHESGELLHTRIESVLGSGIAKGVLSGPTFAKELALGLPTAITLASEDEALTRHWAGLLVNPSFRVYFSQDLVGVQLGGAVKNVIAVGAGMADGLGFGANARTALVTRGLAEMTRLGLALGGLKETFYGMAGLGDLVLTCTDNQSRNRRFGLAIGQGQPLAEAEAAIGQVVEGARNAREVQQLARAMDVDMPIVEQVYRVLYEGLAPKEAARNLLSRALKSEHE